VRDLPGTGCVFTVDLPRLPPTAVWHSAPRALRTSTRLQESCSGVASSPSPFPTPQRDGPG